METLRNTYQNFRNEMSQIFNEKMKYLDPKEQKITTFALIVITIFSAGLATRKVVGDLVNKYKVTNPNFIKHEAQLNKIKEVVSQKGGIGITQRRNSVNSFKARGSDLTDDKLIEFLKSNPSITSLTLIGCDKITDRGLAALKNCPSLTTLSLAGSDKITDKGLAALKNCLNLTTLNLSCCDGITDKGLAHLGENLTSLDLSGCLQITDKGLSLLKSGTKLESLNLSGCENITGETGLETFKALKTLDVSETKFSISGLNTLTCSESLESLNLSKANIRFTSRMSEEVFAKFTSLTALNLNSAAINHLFIVKFPVTLKSLDLSDISYGQDNVLPKEFMDQIGLLKKLKTLNLRGARIEKFEGSLGNFQKLESLENINLSNVQIREKSFNDDNKLVVKYGKFDLNVLKENKDIKTLDLSGNKEINDEDIAILEKFTSLEALDVSETGMTEEGVMSLKREGLLIKSEFVEPEVKEKILKEEQIDDKMSVINEPVKEDVQIGTNTQQEIVEIEEKKEIPVTPVTSYEIKNRAITKEDLEFLEKNKENLKSLDLSGCKDITDEILQEISGLKNLEKLNLSGVQIPEDGFSRFAPLRNLKTLDLSGTNVQEEDLKYFKGAKELKIVGLEKTNMGKTFEQYVNEQKPSNKIKIGGVTYENPDQVTEITIKDLSIDDDDLAALKNFKNLKVLNLAGCENITDKGLEPLKALTNLISVNLSKTKITDDGLDYLKNNKNLELIDLSSCKEFEGLYLFMLESYLENVKSFNCSNCEKFNNSGLYNFENGKLFPKLETINLAKTSISGSGLEYLKSLKNLKSVDVTGCTIDKEDMPKLERVSIQGLSMN